jgi:hypothetical protein
MTELGQPAKAGGHLPGRALTFMSNFTNVTRPELNGKRVFGGGSYESLVGEAV